MKRKSTQIYSVTCEKIARIFIRRIREDLAATDMGDEWAFSIRMEDLEALFALVDLARSDDRLWFLLKAELAPHVFMTRTRHPAGKGQRSLQEVSQ